MLNLSFGVERKEKEKEKGEGKCAMCSVSADGGSSISLYTCRYRCFWYVEVDFDTGTVVRGP